MRKILDIGIFENQNCRGIRATSELVIVLFICITFSAPVFASFDLSKKEVTALASGETIRKPLEKGQSQGVIGGSSFTLVNASPEKVFRAIEDVNVWPKIFPNTYGASVVRKEGNVKSLQLDVGMSLFQTKLHTIVVYEKDKKRIRLRLNKRKDNFADSAKVDVRLLSQPGGRTLVVYMVKTEVPILRIVGLLGDDIVRRFEWALLNVPHRIKLWVEKTGK